MTEETRVARQPENLLPEAITKEQAMFLLKSIWPKAPENDVLKAAILCKQYGLNPLMRQVFLIKFDKWENNQKVGEEWAIVLGIRATRQIAQQALKKRGIQYSYLDGPRVMTTEEQKAIRGKIEPAKIWAITILQTTSGEKYPGYGSYEAQGKPYGSDKGNDAVNMAFIRSERNATDKMAPGALPDIDVGDDTYIEGDFKVALEKGRQQFETQVEEDKKLWDDGKPPSTTTEDVTKQGTGGQTGSEAPDATEGAVTAGNQAGKVSVATSDDLARLTSEMRNAKWDMFRLGKYIKEKGWAVTKTKELTTAQVDEAIKDILADSVK